MNIDRPTYNEAKKYFYINRNYFNLLSEYYALHDKVYYKDVFLTIKIKYSHENPDSFFEYKNFSIMLMISLMIFIFYIIPIEFDTDLTKFKKQSGSITLNLTEKSYFEKALKKFQAGKYTRAKEYFSKVDSTDQNYKISSEMINICNDKICKEGFTDSDIIDENVLLY